MAKKSSEKKAKKTKVLKTDKASKSFRKENKYALITGATSGMGSLFSRHAAAEGFSILALDLDQKKLEELKIDLEKTYGIKVITLVKDLSKGGAVKEVVSFVKDKGVPVQMLINNAGFGYDAPFAQSDKRRQNALEAVDVKVVRQLCRAFLPSMVKNQSGYILNVASVAAFMPGPYMATYFASKSYVYSLTMGLHYEVEDEGVHVTALCPGPTRTPFWDNADAGKTIYVKMAMRPEDVVDAGFRGVLKNKPFVIPGFLAKALVLGSRLLPRGFVTRVALGMNKHQEG